MRRVHADHEDVTGSRQRLHRPLQGCAVDVVEQGVDIVDRCLLEGIESMVEFAFARDRPHLSALKRIACRLLVDAVAVERAELVVGVEVERPRESVHGAWGNIRFRRQLTHGERSDLARVLQEVGGALLELRAELRISPGEAIGAFAKLHAHRYRPTNVSVDGMGFHA